jgi:hypothetical protein
MKMDFCADVRAASANRMQSAALVRNWANVSKRVSILCIWGLTELFARTMVPIPTHNPAVEDARQPKASRIPRSQQGQRYQVKAGCGYYTRNMGS